MTRVKVLGVPVDCINMAVAVNTIDTWIKEDCKAKTVIAVNPEKVIAAQNNPELMRSVTNAGLLIPDGIGIVIATMLLQLGKMQRVPGAELMPALCSRAAKEGYRVFLFGATGDVNLAAAERLQKEYPDLQIVGRHDGYMSEDNMAEIISKINESRAQILFIALGSPRQEQWMDKYLPELDVNVCQGVGGTFDVIAGNIKRAPIFFRKMNLEWFYRLASQPKRLKRQRALPIFACRVLKEWISIMCMKQNAVITKNR